MAKREAILRKLRKALDPERFRHSLRVEKIALALAKKYGVSGRKASLAALLHDYARKYGRKGLLRQARKHGLRIDPVREFEPKLFHAELSALLAKKDLGIRAPEILSAIRNHTIGAPGMKKLDKIIYLADHIEEGRNFRGVKKVRSLAKRDLDRAIAESASNMLQFLLKKGLPIDPGTIRTRNYYLMKK